MNYMITLTVGEVVFYLVWALLIFLLVSSGSQALFAWLRYRSVTRKASRTP